MAAAEPPNCSPAVPQPHGDTPNYEDDTDGRRLNRAPSIRSKMLWGFGVVAALTVVGGLFADIHGVPAIFPGVWSLC